MRAILAGGGTGGHVIPAIAIAQQLQKDYGAEVLFIGTARGIENRLVPGAGYALELVKVGALKNVSFATRAKTAFDLPRAIWNASGILGRFHADVVIGVGGRSEEHTSELQSLRHLVCRLLLEKKKV